MTHSCRFLMPILAGWIASCAPASVEQKSLPCEEIVADSEKVMVEHQKWLKKKPRKLATRFLDTLEMPARMVKLGFKSAAVEEGFVVFISTWRGTDPIRRIAVSNTSNTGRRRNF